MLRPLMIATVWPATGIVPARMAATGAAPARGPGDAERVITGRGGGYPWLSPAADGAASAPRTLNEPVGWKLSSFRWTP